MAKRGRPPHPDILTPREWEVLALLREGCSNEDIASRLGVSLAGAKYHVSEILSKLGVSSREEAARWRPERRPWWAAALAPMALVWRRPRLDWLSPAVAGGLAVAVAAGVALLVWRLLAMGDGEGEERGVDAGGNSAQVTAVWSTYTPVTPDLPPIPTPAPYASDPVDCPGGFATPEEAIEACIEQEPAAYTYVGDCDLTPQELQAVDLNHPCSTWEDGTRELRSYALLNIGVDGYGRVILQQNPAGWITIGRSGCSIQNQFNLSSSLAMRGDPLSPVRSDACSYPPEPMQRPTVRLGPYRPVQAANGRTELSVAAAAFYPGRGIRLELWIKNISGQVLPWRSDVSADIELVGEDGTYYEPSEIGGTIARDVPDGLPTGESWSGWLVFPVEQFGTYTLHYPEQPDLRLVLTPEEYDGSYHEFFDNLKSGKD